MLEVKADKSKEIIVLSYPESEEYNLSIEYKLLDNM